MYYHQDYYYPGPKSNVTVRSIPFDRICDIDYDNSSYNHRFPSSSRFIINEPAPSLVGHKRGVWRTDGFSSGPSVLNYPSNSQYAFNSLPVVSKSGQNIYSGGSVPIKYSKKAVATYGTSKSDSRYGLGAKSRSQWDVSHGGYGGRRHDYLDDDDDDNDDVESGYGSSTVKQNGEYNKGKPTTMITRACVGLMNLGNTCFMNSILQCLSNTLPLLMYFLKPRFQSDIVSNRFHLVTEFAQVIHGLWKARHAISPDNFRYEVALCAKSFSGYSQHDAQEFLMFLLQRLSEDLNRAPKDKKDEASTSVDTEEMSASEKAEQLWKDYLEHENSIITDLFMGQLRSQLRYSECGHTSNAFDPCLGLSLPIKKSIGFQDITLMDCLELHSQEEKMDGQERTMCDKCKKKQKANKQLLIQKFPEILIIHLKRFSKSRFGHSKLTTKVRCPSVLDMSRFSASETPKEKQIYDLYAVCNHYGTASGGHYVACAKSPPTGRWFLYNDDKVECIPDLRAVTSDAYILFYKLSSSKLNSVESEKF